MSRCSRSYHLNNFGEDCHFVVADRPYVSNHYRDYRA